MAQDDAQKGPVVFSADDSEVFQKEIRETISGLAYLAQLAKEGKPIDRGLMYNVLYLADARVADMAKLSGVEIDSIKRQEERHAEIRRANIRIRELERLVGAGVSAEQTKMTVKGLLERVNRWWRKDGLGHVRESHMDDWGGVRITLSCSLFGNFITIDSKTPVTDKDRRKNWLNQLRAEGLVLTEGTGHRCNVVDCDQSRNTLISMVNDALPLATVDSFTNQSVQGQLVLREMKLYISEISDLERLPAPSENVESED